jgi:hypothetical protein
MNAHFYKYNTQNIQVDTELSLALYQIIHNSILKVDSISNLTSRWLVEVITPTMRFAI